MDMLQDLIDADDIVAIMGAFENRMGHNKRWRQCKPNKADIILEKIDKDFEEWTSENTRQKMHAYANQYFTSNIINPQIQTDPRNWHKCLKQFS